MRAFADADCELARTVKLKDRELDAVTGGPQRKARCAGYRGLGTFAELRGPNPRRSRS
jgi:hypothetical protein